MAATAVIAAVALGSTAYSASQQKKASQEQADQLKKQESTLAQQEQDRKNKEASLTSQAFQNAAGKRASGAPSLPGAVAATPDSIGNVGAATLTPGKTLIGS